MESTINRARLGAHGAMAWQWQWHFDIQPCLHLVQSTLVRITKYIDQLLLWYQFKSYLELRLRIETKEEEKHDDDYMK